jgi:hypothetical protein
MKIRLPREQFCKRCAAQISRHLVASIAPQPCARSLEYCLSNRGLLTRDEQLSRCAPVATEETGMKTTASLALFCSVAMILVAGPRPSEALVNAAQLYPYCQISSSNGGMNCYLSSRVQCEFREVCINNPGYLGTEGARVWKRNNKPQWRWW